MFSVQEKRPDVPPKRPGPPPKRFGPPPKRPGEKRRSLQIELYEDQIKRFKELTKWLGKNNAGTLIYLMDNEELYKEKQQRSPNAETAGTTCSTPQRVRVAVPSSSRTSSPVAAKRALLCVSPISAVRMVAARGGLIVDEEISDLHANEEIQGGEDGMTASASSATAPQRVPVYAGVENSQPASAPIPDEGDISEEFPDPDDVYEFEPEREDDGLANVNVDQLRHMRSYHEQSLNVSDNNGQLLREPEPPVTSAALEAAKSNDPRDYDYADSPRLIPQGHHRLSCEGLQCRLHVSKTVLDNDAAGVLIDSENARRSQDAFEIAQAKRYIIELSQLMKLMSPKCYRSGCIDLNDFTTLIVRRDGAACVISIQCKGPLKHKNPYDHLPSLMALCLHRRATTAALQGTRGFTNRLDLANDPRKLASNTAKSNENREEVIARHTRMTRMGRVSQPSAAQLAARLASANIESTDEESSEHGDTDYEHSSEDE